MYLEDIIVSAQKNERAAQEKLYKEFRVVWYQICLRYNKGNADDVLQDALIKIFRKIHLFDPSKGSFKSWSCKVVVNENLMYLRKNSNVFDHYEINDEILTYKESDTSAMDILSAEELMKMIQRLPKGYRTVFNLYVMEGYTHKEISENLGISIGTSKSQLSKARRMLQKQLQVLF